MPFFTKSMINQNKQAFTLIELLVVVSVIGILSGIVLNIINVQRQRDIANDSVSRANLEKASQGLEAYYLVKGTYPATLDTECVSDFIKIIPDGLTYSVNAEGTQALMQILMLSQENTYLKYLTEAGKIQECGGGGGFTTCTAPGVVPPQVD